MAVNFWSSGGRGGGGDSSGTLSTTVFRESQSELKESKYKSINKEKKLLLITRKTASTNNRSCNMG